MADILSSIAGSSTFLLGWLLPSAIATGSWVILMLPRVSRAGWSLPTSLDTAAEGLIVAFSAVVIAYILGAMSTPLYRLLEGYLWWPKWLYDRRVDAQRKRQAKLANAALECEPGTLEYDLAWEKADKYPTQAQQIGPTRLGNAIRAMETYGSDRFGLDSQRFWSELTAVVPASLSDDVTHARSQVDFFVAMFYLLIFFGLSAVFVFLSELNSPVRSVLDWTTLTVALAALALPAVWYKLAVSAVSFWRSTTQAVVNIGRGALAAQLGLRLPETLAEERLMWEKVASLLAYPAADTSGELLDEYRLR